MSQPPLPETAVSLLRKPNPAVISTLRSDGHPVSTATWYLWEDDGRVLINLDEGRVRLRHLRNDPRVSLTVLAGDDWYTHVSLIGRVTGVTEDTALAGIDRLSRHYTGKEYPRRDRTRYNAWIEVERWHGWGSLKDSDQTG
ncbi:PPOX class F420-dependent oxidoreductase [Streptomyces tremellae]|uniref:PPOX class F420-dependent oxidoreductase n=1 Tax=Streptomyces tremellae TaxID=1124239 RepID=A0ABP7E5N3_9ACTN